MEIDVTILGFSTAGRKQPVKRSTDGIYDGAHVSPAYMYIQQCPLKRPQRTLKKGGVFCELAREERVGKKFCEFQFCLLRYSIIKKFNALTECISTILNLIRTYI